MSQLKALRQKLAEMCCEYGAHREENVGPKKQVKGEQLKKLSTVMRKRAEMEGAADYAVPAAGVVSPGLAAILSAVQAPAGAGWSHAGRTFGGGMLGVMGGGALGSALGGLAGHSELGNLIGALSGSALGSHMGHQSAKAKAKEPASEVQKLSALLKQTAAPAVAAATPQKPMLQGDYWDKIRSNMKPAMKTGSEMQKLREKLAFLPALAAALPAIGSAVGGMAARTGLMAGGRAVLGMGARAMANPIGNAVGQQALGMGAQKLMQPRQPPQGALPGQIGGV